VTWHHLFHWLPPRTVRRTRRARPRLSPWRLVRPRRERLEDRMLVGVADTPHTAWSCRQSPLGHPRFPKSRIACQESRGETQPACRVARSCPLRAGGQITANSHGAGLTRAAASGAHCRRVTPEAASLAPALGRFPLTPTPKSRTREWTPGPRENPINEGSGRCRKDMPESPNALCAR
jgi:hypothetical protein